MVIKRSVSKTLLRGFKLLKSDPLGQSGYFCVFYNINLNSASFVWVAKDPSFLHADSEDSDQTGRMPRLI